MGPATHHHRGPRRVILPAAYPQPAASTGTPSAKPAPDTAADLLADPHPRPLQAKRERFRYTTRTAGNGIR